MKTVRLNLINLLLAHMNQFTVVIIANYRLISLQRFVLPLQLNYTIVFSYLHLNMALVFVSSTGGAMQQQSTCNSCLQIIDQICSHSHACPSCMYFYGLEESRMRSRFAALHLTTMSYFDSQCTTLPKTKYHLRFLKTNFD